MGRVVEAAAGVVRTVNAAVVAAAATVTLEGVLATFVLLLESVTTAPPEGAAPLRVTVPVEEFPPVTLVGFTESEERVAAGGAADVRLSSDTRATAPHGDDRRTFGEAA